MDFSEVLLSLWGLRKKTHVHFQMRQVGLVVVAFLKQEERFLGQL